MSRRDCIEEISLSAYLDGELGEQETRVVEKHLADCRDCFAVCESIKSDRNLLLQSLPDSEPPAFMKAQLFGKLHAETGAAPISGILTWSGIRQTLSFKTRSWALACASFVFLAIIILSAFHLQQRIQDGRMLAQIDRSRAEWTARDKGGNPFNIDLNGMPLRPASENPFKAFLDER